MKKPFAVLIATKTKLAVEKDADAELAFIETAIGAFEAYRTRVAMDPGLGYYRATTPERRQSIIRFYEQAALTMYKGFVKRMERYAASEDTHRRRIAALVAESR